FLLEALEDLDRSLRKLNSRLFVIRGQPADVLPKLYKDWQITHLTMEAEPEPFGRARDKNIIAISREYGVHVSIKTSHTLYRLDSIIERNGSVPPVTYRQFQLILQSMDPPPPPVAAVTMDTVGSSKTPLRQDHEDEYGVPTLEELGFEVEAKDHSSALWVGGESEALSRLERHLERKAWIASFGNPKFSPQSLMASQTGLSPYLRFGCLSCRLFFQELTKLYRQVRKSPPPVSLYGQLLWREFFYTAATKNPKFDRMVGNPICLQIPWDKNPQALAKWATGNTGFPWIDAIMRQLRIEGWVHHLARHALACFLTRGDLWLSWEDGMKVFEELLLDSDWSINAGTWMWLSCSSFFQTFFHSYCPVKFGRKADPSGDYIRKYVPVLKNFPTEYIHEPWIAPLEVQQQAKCVIGRNYPLPMVNHAEASRRNFERLRQVYRSLPRPGGFSVFRMDQKPSARPFRAAPPPPLPARGAHLISAKLQQAASILSTPSSTTKHEPPKFFVDLLTGDEPSVAAQTNSSSSIRSRSQATSARKKVPPPRPPPPKKKVTPVSGISAKSDVLVDIGSDGGSIHSSGSDAGSGPQFPPSSMSVVDAFDPFSPVSWGQRSSFSTVSVASLSNSAPQRSSSLYSRPPAAPSSGAPSSVLSDLRDIFQSSLASSNHPSPTVFGNGTVTQGVNWTATSSNATGVQSRTTSVKRDSPVVTRKAFEDETLITSASNAVADLPKWKPTVIRARPISTPPVSTTVQTSTVSSTTSASITSATSIGENMNGSRTPELTAKSWSVSTDSLATASSSTLSAGPSLPPRPKTSEIPYAVALYDYDSGNPEDLVFKAGDTILLHHWINEDWLEGSISGVTGMFPANFIQAGVLVHVTGKINKEWLTGSYRGFRGQFPVSFVSHVPKRFRES
ncbi:unnamed protein product, partial [Cyprideis torosa]